MIFFLLLLNESTKEKRENTWILNHQNLGNNELSSNHCNDHYQLKIKEERKQIYHLKINKTNFIKIPLKVDLKFISSYFLNQVVGYSLLSFQHTASEEEDKISNEKLIYFFFIY